MTYPHLGIHETRISILTGRITRELPLRHL